MSTVKANTIEPASGGTVTITGAALTTPALGTPASGNLANCTGLPASAVANTPAGGISATTVQAALNELDNEKFDKSGGTISGNVGVGAAPSSWGSYSAVDIGGSGAIAASFSGSTATQIVNGAYYNGTNWVYKYTGVGVARYEQSDSSGGVHRWSSAPSGTAGSAISFTQAMTLDASGNLGIGVTPSAWGSGNRGSLEIGPSYRSLALTGDSPADGRVMQNAYYNGTNWIYSASFGASGYRQTQGSHAWFIAPSGTAGSAISFTQSMTLDASGNLLVGTSSSTYHTLRKNVTADAGNPVAEIQGNSGTTVAIFYGVTGYGANAANAAMGVGFDNVTNRSIKAGGSIVGNGADVSEYEGNGGLRVVKGQIVGFDASGVLTDRFDSALRFGVKSTNPYLVGNDAWCGEDKIGKRPVEPAPPGSDATEDEAQAYAQALQQYQSALAEFLPRLEAARQLVDRIAYCGKVPCNVTGATPGDYIVAVDDGSGGIKGLPVRNPTFEQYRAAVGRVNRILPDGRAEIAVIVH